MGWKVRLFTPTCVALQWFLWWFCLFLCDRCKRMLSVRLSPIVWLYSFLRNLLWCVTSLWIVSTTQGDEEERKCTLTGNLTGAISLQSSSHSSICSYDVSSLLSSVRITLFIIHQDIRSYNCMYWLNNAENPEVARGNKIHCRLQ